LFYDKYPSKVSQQFPSGDKREYLEAILSRMQLLQQTNCVH